MRSTLPPPVIRGYRFLTRARDKAAALAFGSAFGSFGRHTVIELPMHIEGETSIFVGSGIWLGRNASLVVTPGTGASIQIGDGSTSSGMLGIHAEAPVVLGRDVLMAANVSILTQAAFESRGTHAGVEIGDGAWIGENVVVYGGVRIGKGAVIGANSTVTSDVPDHGVAVGNPARLTGKSRQSP